VAIFIFNVHLGEKIILEKIKSGSGEGVGSSSQCDVGHRVDPDSRLQVGLRASAPIGPSHPAAHQSGGGEMWQATHCVKCISN
jgi:hypothetical protein